MDLAERRDLETDVYQPAEDSHLLAQAAVDRLESRSPDWILDVGTGSGYVAEQLREGTTAHVIGADVNPHACREAAERGIDAVRADLVSPFADDSFDAVVFNPPYLPFDADAARDDWMERALSGGKTGRAVIDPFLSRVERVCRPDGVVLLLVSTLTDVEAVTELAGDAGFSAVAVADESFPYERLTVLELHR